MWANDPVKGGGNVISQGCHSCDILRFVAGAEPLEVYAAGGNYYQGTGVVDNLCAVFRFDNGAAGSWVQGDAACPSLFLGTFHAGWASSLLWLSRGDGATPRLAAADQSRADMGDPGQAGPDQGSHASETAARMSRSLAVR